jgi:hypothetical protein
MPIFSAPSFSRRISSGYKRKFFGILIGGFKDVVRIGIPCLYERFQRVYNYLLLYAKIFAVLFGLHRLSLGFPLYSQCGTPVLCIRE